MTTRSRRLSALAALAVALLTAIASPASAGGHGRDTALRVVSYNIHAGAGSDGRFAPGRQAAVLRSLHADVIGLEEVDVHWSDRSQWRDLTGELARALGMRAYFAPIYDLAPPSAGAPRRQYGIAVLSRFPIVRAENHEITRLSTQEENPVPAPAPGFPEVVVNARGAPVHVYATHLDYRPDPAVREMQVADTRKILEADGRSARQILLGDFNATPGAGELAPLWRTLTDTWPAAGRGAGLTYPAEAPDRRIDYVTVSRIVGVRGAYVPATLASDHRPVVADLVVHRPG